MNGRVAIEGIGVFVDLDAIEIQSDALLHQLARGGQDPEDADAAGDRVRLGEDVVRGAADVVPTAGGQIAHRGHDRLARLLQQDGLAPDDIAGEGAAPGRIHAEHHGADLRVEAGFPEGAGDSVRTDGGIVPLPALDGPLGEVHRHGIGLRLFVLLVVVLVVVVAAFISSCRVVMKSSKKSGLWYCLRLT